MLVLVRHSSLLLASSAIVLRSPLRPPPLRCTLALSASAGEGGSVTGIIYDAQTAGSPTVSLFTKEGCTLCDKAVEVLRQAAETQPHTLRAVDITDAEHEQWWGRYKYDIPVLHIDDVYWAKHRRVANPGLTDPTLLATDPRA